VREQACRINELEAANNHQNQEIKAIRVDMHDLVKSFRSAIGLPLEGGGLIKRINHHNEP